MLRLPPLLLLRLFRIVLREKILFLHLFIPENCKIVQRPLTVMSL